MLLLNLSSESFNKHTVSSVGREIAEKYNTTAELENMLLGYAKSYGFYITVFSADIDRDFQSVDELYLIKSVTPVGVSGEQTVNWNSAQRNTFFNLNYFRYPDEKTFFYTLSSPPTYVYAEVLTDRYGQEVFLYLELYRTEVNVTLLAMLPQMAIASVIALVAASVLSVLLSRRMSTPLVQFSRTAKAMSRGKYDVRYEGNGYREIEELADTLNYAISEIKKNDEFRKEFLANITHDLRTPITMIKGYAELIRDISGGNAEKRAQHTQTIIDESDRLTALIENILLMTKLEAGTADLKFARTDMSQLVKGVIERFRLRVLRDGFVFRCEVEDGLFANVDCQKIEQALYNLIENATHYTGEDRVISVRLFALDDGNIRAEVADTGKGIPPDELEFIWERYYRVSLEARHKTGAGIGLNIVKGILQRHNALFGVDSKLGIGTTFWFQLPLV